MKLEPYQERIVELIEEGKIPSGEFFMVEVAHDDGCKALTGDGKCTCTPDLYLKGKKL